MQKKIIEGFSTVKSGFLYGVLTKNENTTNKSNKILYVTNKEFYPNGFLSYIVVSNANNIENKNIFYIKENIEFENETIIIKIDYENSIIYEIVNLSKSHIDLYLTGKCTQNCIACPQPQEARNDIMPNYEALEIARLLQDIKTHINISGGEPTFNKKYFIKVIKEIQNKSPQSTMQILTNALSFSKNNFIKAIVDNDIKFDKLMFSIALYGSNQMLHDKATRTKNSFRLLDKAINNIYRNGGKVEIRVVINKMNYNNLLNIAELVIEKYKDIAFRVVFMGLEMSGEADVNNNDVWIPFEEHVEYLEKAIISLLKSNITVYLYNYPLCFLPKKFWSLSKDSISYWKKNYKSKCSNCAVQSQCPGFFKHTLKYVNNVYPIIQ